MADKEGSPLSVSEQESMLTQLLKEEKKQSNLLRIMMLANIILAVCLVAALVIVVPRVNAVAGKAEAAVTDVQALIKQAEGGLSDVIELAGQAETSLEGIDKVVENANTILTENASGMNEAIENFNKVDFESLNQAINDLSDAVAPLADFARAFG